jgi:hypothetical protein
MFYMREGYSGSLICWSLISRSRSKGAWDVTHVSFTLTSTTRKLPLLKVCSQDERQRQDDCRSFSSPRVNYPPPRLFAAAAEMDVVPHK